MWCTTHCSATAEHMLREGIYPEMVNKMFTERIPNAAPLHDVTCGHHEKWDGSEAELLRRVKYSLETLTADRKESIIY